MLNHSCTRNNKTNLIWTDREGKKYYCLCEFTDNHLLNLVNYLENNPPEIPSFPIFNGEMAQMIAEGYWESDCEEIRNKYNQLVKRLKQEIKKRKIE